MKRFGIDSRYQGDKGEIYTRHGSTLIGLLRKIYGFSIAPGVSDQQTLGDALSMTPDMALSPIYEDYHKGMLGAKIERAKVEADCTNAKLRDAARDAPEK